MANEELSQFTELAEGPAIADLFGVVDVSDTTDASTGTTKRNKAQYALGSQVNAQTGTTYTYLTTDFRKLVTHSNGSAIAGTLPQAGASFPAGWFMFVQNRSAGVLTITPTTSTIDGAATLVLSQNEGAIVISDGTNYFTLRGKATGAAGVGDVVGPASATNNALARFDTTTGKLIQNSAITADDDGAVTVPEIAAPSTPATGKVVLYAKSDGLLYSKDDAGTESAVSGGGGATINATDNVLPRRSNSTTFADSLLTHEAANSKTHTTGHFSIDQNTNRVLGFANSGSAIAFGGLAAAGVGAMKVVADAAGNPGTILAGFATPPAPGGIPTPWSSNGMNYRQVLTGNVTIGNPGQSGGNGTAIDGYRFIFMLVQDGTGSRTAAWHADFNFPGGTAPTLTTTADAVDIFEFICFGDQAYCIGQWLDVK